MIAAAFSPVIKCFMFTTTGLSLLAPVLAPGTSFNLQIPLVLRGQLWRLITSNLVFSTPAELLFGQSPTPLSTHDQPQYLPAVIVPGVVIPSSCAPRAPPPPSSPSFTAQCTEAAGDLGSLLLYYARVLERQMGIQSFSVIMCQLSAHCQLNFVVVRHSRRSPSPSAL